MSREKLQIRGSGIIRRIDGLRSILTLKTTFSR